jgi:hypothetical protein
VYHWWWLQHCFCPYFIFGLQEEPGTFRQFTKVYVKSIKRLGSLVTTRIGASTCMLLKMVLSLLAAMAGMMDCFANSIRQKRACVTSAV